MTVRFTPPFPDPHPAKSSLLRRFLRGWNSWIHVMFEKSYTMKMGEIHLPAQTFYIANELPLVRRILETEAGQFPKHRFLQDMLDPLIGNSLFSANGKDWADQRAMVNPAFGHTALKTVFPLMADAVDDIVRRMSALDHGQPVAIDPLMTHVAADIIFRTLFSVTLDQAGSAEIFDAFEAYQKHSQRGETLKLYRLPQLGYRRKARRDAARIHAVFAPVVADRYAATHDRGERGNDIVQSLIDARHPETGAPFTQAQVMEQVSTIFLAGHETAASSMTWALYLLARDPALQDAIRDEMRAAAGNAPLAHEHLRGLGVTRNVFRETLRLYPPVSFLVRAVSCPVQMRDKDLKAGAVLVVSPWLVQRNRDNFPEPHGFDPDRFDDPAQAAPCKHAYLPFGKGPRVCVGAGFAQQEALLTIAGIVRRFDLAAIPGDVPEPVSRLTLRAGNGVRLRLHARD
ncbi:cytochrome P450 [Sphingomonas sp. Leaf17]|uniref:cytochrome P450 n=1 Tax=Sphingomonas sp. Leaf17 TaxID=1735683 RepID=UPI0006FF1B92|nr:cytochrome P450 [Sphingomonas sp. Leaf17]KQM67910.1 cytochrome P450 [Sphingomonas sp. Leaf17]